MSITLRLSSEPDLPLLLELVRAYHDLEGITHSDPDPTAAIRPLLGESPLGRLWLICADAEPIGYVAICFGYSIEFAGRDAFVDELFVIEQQRGKGIGKAALALVKAEAAALGVKVLHLEVSSSNDRARRLYRSAGFLPRRFSLMSAHLDSASPWPDFPDRP